MNVLGGLLVVVVASSQWACVKAEAPPPPAPSGSTPAWSLQFATRVPAAGTAMAPPKAISFVLGERWGCAAFETGSGPAEQCWEAGPAPRARRVPWMDGEAFRVAPDHLCSLAKPELKFRCWKRPIPGETVGRLMPGRWQWMNPYGAASDDAGWRADQVVDAEVGGTFSCLLTKDDSVFCLGDNRFGQLGGRCRCAAATCHLEGPRVPSRGTARSGRDARALARLRGHRAEAGRSRIHLVLGPR